MVADIPVIVADMLRYRIEERAAYSIANDIATIANKHNMDALLVAAQISVESRYRPRALGRSNDKGLLQITPIGYRQVVKLRPDLGGQESRLYEVAFNLDCGLTLLMWCRKCAKGVWRLAFGRYNGGRRIPVISLAYADKILSRYAYLVKLRKGS